LDKALTEIFNEVQVYSSIAVLVKEGFVKIERYVTVELENLGEGWFRASIMNANRWVKDYCVKRFTVHPFSVPVPLFTVNKIVRE
jgi:hypothetical protein